MLPKFLTRVLYLSILLGSALFAQSANAAFTDNGNGTVSDTVTGLMWQRCAKGQIWSGSTCSGNATTYTWDAAAAITDSFAGQTDWRLPNLTELQWLLNPGSSPTRDTTTFPNTPVASFFWSGSPYAPLPLLAWAVNSDFGDTVASYKASNYYVRLVRGEQSIGTFALTVTKAGTGSGTITSNTGGIDCGATCSASFAGGTKVILTATPSSGSTFAGWSGDCTGTGSCVVTMSAAKAVTATFKPAPFVAISNNDITATTATVATTVAFNATDVGKPGAVFVTAWVPASGLGALGISTAPLPNAFVLVQLTSTGWQLVMNGQLIPYTSGTLAEQSVTLTILNNTDKASILGAQICVGYGTGATSTASDMIRNGRMQLTADVPDPNAASTSMGSCIIQNYSDSWWNASESGWGLTIIDHDTSAFVQWHTYDQTGHNQKYVISGIFSNGKCLLTGDIQHITGPSWTLPTFDANQVIITTVGSGSIDFCPSGLASGAIVFNYNNVDGITGSKQLTRLPFGDDVPHWGGVANTGAADFTDLWWNPSEPGWGVGVTQHGNNIFFRIFVYDTDGRPLLFAASGAPSSSGTSFSGAVTLTTGPWFGSNPFDPNQVVRTATPGNTATLTFSDANNGMLSYTVNGITVMKAITRLAF